MNQMGVFALSTLLLLLSSSLVLFCVSDDRLLPGESLLTNRTLVSDGGTFAVGFFTLDNSTSRRYLGIWYNKIPGTTVVWVANRENPFTDSSVVLHISNDFRLVVSNLAGGVLWFSNTSGAGASPTGASRSMAAVLLESGNLVLRSAEDDVRWQSFDYPGNTLLPGMKLWFNKTTGVATGFTSWKDEEDPSPGDFSVGADLTTGLQVMIWKGTKIYWRYNPWDGYLVGGSSMLDNVYASYISIERNDEGAVATFTSSSSLTQRITMEHTGVIQLSYWDKTFNNWKVLISKPDATPCEIYAACGPYGFCNKTAARPTCHCLAGYEPRVRSEWSKGVYSGGCAPRRAMRCGGEDVFATLVSTKLPDKMVYLENVTSERDCEAACRSNCSCTAYANSNVTTRCYVWQQELIDVEQYDSTNTGEDLHFRHPEAESTQTANRQKVISRRFIIIPIIIGVTLSVILMCLVWSYRNTIQAFWKGTKREGVQLYNVVSPKVFSEGGEEGSVDLPLQSFACIASATNNFADSNKLGEGGFGKVYKGILCNGEEIAIKRLSEGSRQGQEEFKNEVALIVKLQHKNLVRLLGSCIEGEERILIYEYLSNSSLNTFLFDTTKRVHLDWGKHFNIIKGIARGLMYLHEGSRLKIVHRDLKASNILLDRDMNPKISDFGMARIFGGDQSRAITNRVVGTYGYMSPEYAMEGLFSIKSDVYSFGVLLLEIISGRRNISFYHNGVLLNLLTYGWQLWKEDNVMEFLDSSITQIDLSTEVTMCVHVGLLCVQDHVSERPLMSSVVFMLENNAPIQAIPERPIFMLKGDRDESGSQKNSTPCCSKNDLSITTVEGR